MPEAGPASGGGGTVPVQMLSVTQHSDGPEAHDAQPGRVQPVFYYDLGSPECYLAAERAMATLPVVPEWTPILAAGFPGHAPGDVAARRAGVERQAATAHVQALRWPPAWPGDTRLAMIAATYAKQIGRAVAFSLAAFRQAFAGGRELDEDTILIAAAACEMHPKAVLVALKRASVAGALEAATAEAAAAGVRDVPAVRIGTRVFHGEHAIEEAAAALGELAAADPELQPR